MWILGLLLLVLLLGFKGFIKTFIIYIICGYILYLIAIFCPILIAPILLIAFVKYYIF